MLQAALMWAAGLGCGLLWAAAQRVGLRDPTACAPPCASLSPSGWLFLAHPLQASYEQLEEVPASVPQGVDEILEVGPTGWQQKTAHSLDVPWAALGTL